MQRTLILRYRNMLHLSLPLLFAIIFILSPLGTCAPAVARPLKPFFQLTLLNQESLGSDDHDAMQYYQVALDQIAQQQYLDAGLSLMEIITFHNKSPYYGAALYRLANLYENPMANNVPSRLVMAHTLYQKTSKLPSTVYNSGPRGRASTKLIAMKQRQLY